MKILMFAPQPFLEPRGTPISVYQRLQALSVLQYQVDLITYHVGQDVSIPGVKVHRSPHLPFIKSVKLGPSWPKAFLDVLLFCQGIALLLVNRYDVIHSHEEAAFWSVLLAKVFRTRHVYDMHSSLPQQLATCPRWNYRPFVKLFEVLERWVISTCDAVITIGVDLEERVMAINPKARTVLMQNLAVLADGAGLSHTSASELREKLRLDNKLAVVYTGTFERYQGLDLLLRSAKIVKEHYPDVIFILVGGDPRQVEHWRHQFGLCGLGDSVIFTGTVPLADSIAYLDIAEILVSPRTQGTSVPLKIYSYLHSGKPIVATDLTAHSQVLNTEMAVLVAPTEEAFANGILALAQSPDVRKRLGLRAQQFARERFDPADYLVKLERLYQELIPTSRRSEQAARSPQSDSTHTPQEQWLRHP
ncbi:MAG: glycosyltransferase family 4 protein [Anaerolineae bacterium]|nr:glycosyltransferase family 4 protein [Anaerolineae bacterium]